MTVYSSCLVCFKISETGGGALAAFLLQSSQLYFMLNIVLHSPEIPQNTGNIARTCAAIGADLHIVEPIMFDISEKAVRRAGLDYWDKVRVLVHKNYRDFVSSVEDDSEFYYCSTKAKILYTDVSYPENKNIYLVFGCETKGLPEHIIFENYDRAIRIPMLGNIRSLNLSNSAAIVAYEVIRQNGLKNNRNYTKIC